MKKFISGLIIGAIMFTFIPIQAAVQEYVLQKVSYKVIVNGTEYNDPELPVLTLKTESGDNTYVPLRALGDILGADVSWNSELGQVEVGNQPQQSVTPPTGSETSTQSEYEVYTEGGYTYLEYQSKKYIRAADIRSESGTLSWDYNTQSLIFTIDSQPVLTNIKNYILYQGSAFIENEYFIEHIKPLMNNSR